MQLDGNIFCGDVVLDRINIVFSYEDSILDIIFEKHIFSHLYYKEYQILTMIEENASKVIQYSKIRNS